MADSSSTMSTVPSEDVSSGMLVKRLSAVSGIDHLAQHGEFHGERGALAGRAIDVNLARMLLNDAVGHRQAQPCASAVAAAGLLALGGEERIVDAVNVFLRDAATSVGHGDAHVVSVAGRDGKCSAGRHSVFGIQEKIEEHLLQLAGVAEDWRQAGMQLGHHLNARRLELVLQQRERVLDYAVQVHVVEVRARGAGEVQQAVDNLRGAEGLPGDLFQQFRLFGIVVYLFREHLRVGRDHGQRGVDLMRHTRRQQADGGKLLRLRKLRLQLDALGDVVHDDQPADDAEAAAHQRRDGDVGDTGFARGGAQPELVQVVNASAESHPAVLVEKRRREYVAQRLAQHLRPRHGIHYFHLRVPRFDAVLQVHRQHADTDGLDNVLAELFQPLVLGDLALQRTVQARILDGNADVSCQGFQQLHVFGGEEISFGGLAQSQHGDHAIHHVAGNVVVEVEALDGLACLRRFAHRLRRVVEEQVASPPLRALHVEESQVHLAGVSNAVRLGQHELVRPLRVCQEDGQAVDHQSVGDAVDDGGQHLVEVGLGVQVAAEFDQRPAVVVTLTVEELVEVVLHPVLEGGKQRGRDGDRDHQADRSGAGKVLMEDFRDAADGREVRRRDGAGCDGVRHTALENEVDVHQAIAEDSVAKRQRKEYQRQHGYPHTECRHPTKQAGDHVEQW